MTEQGELFLLLSSPMRVVARLVPLLVSLFLVILANLPVSFTGGLVPAPVLALAAVYFWALTRPHLMPPAAVLMIGLAEDLLSGGPPGLWAAGFIAAYVVTDRQRKDLAELTGAGAVFAFAVAVSVAAVTAYTLASLIYLRFVPLPPLLLEGIVTVMLYPLLDRPFHWVDHAMIRFLRGG